MSASKLNPNLFHGLERDGGYLYRNERPTSTTSPHWRGKIWLTGIGWYWLSAWEQDVKTGLFFKLRAQEMTDAHAIKYCAYKDRPQRNAPEAGQRQIILPEPGGENSSDSDIPF